MKNTNLKTVPVQIKDLYQLLLAECRYGYSRSNHLMPYGAYDHVKTYLTALCDTDHDMGIQTAQQLCEECIEYLWMHFPDGIEDDNGNRKGAIEFIQYLIDFVQKNHQDNWIPYNFTNYISNVAKDYEPKYSIYETEYPGHKYVSDLEPTLGKKITKTCIALADIMTYVAKNIVKKDEFTYRKFPVGIDRTKKNVGL